MKADWDRARKHCHRCEKRLTCLSRNLLCEDAICYACLHRLVCIIRGWRPTSVYALQWTCEGCWEEQLIQHDMQERGWTGVSPMSYRPYHFPDEV